MLFPVALSALISSLAWPLSAAPPGPGSPHPLRASLLTDHSVVTPGQTFRLGITFDIEPGWHTYWPGDNDTGAPTTFKWDLPPGWVVGEIQWPVPTRHISPGDLLDYVYEGHTTLIVPMTVPKDAGLTDAPVRVQVGVSWLVCKSICIPGSADLNVPVKVGLSSEASPDAQAIDSARSFVPAPLPPSLSPVFDDDHAIFASIGAKFIAFYPEDGCAVITHALESALVEGDRLNLPLESFDAKRPILMGVLVISRGSPIGPKSVVEAYRVHVPRPLPPASTPTHRP